MTPTLETETGQPIQGYNLPGQYYLQHERRGKGYKLTCKEVELIRRMARWGWTCGEIAPHVPISKAAVSSVIQRKSYKDCRS